MPVDLGGMGAHFGVKIDLETGGFQTYAGQLNRVSASTGALVATTNKFNMSWKSMVGGFLLAQAGFAVVTKGMQTIINVIGETASSFRDFENAMTEVSTIMGNLEMDLLPGLETGVESLSIAFGKSATDLANGLYNILSAAVPVEDAMQLLYTSTKAAVAGLSDVSTSVDVMTSVLNAYGKTVEQMVHVSDVMFQAIIRGKFRYEDLASSLGYVTPIAAQVGIEFEELAATMATATRHGQHIDMVSRGLALTMQNIIKPGQQAVQVAADYGIELSLASLRAKGLVGFLKDLNTKTGGNAAIISQIIPNMRSYRVAMVLAGEGVEGVEEDITLMSESLGKADLAFSKMASTSQMATNIIEQSFEDVNRSIGEMTIETDLMMKKLGVFKNFFVSDFIGGIGKPSLGQALGPLGTIFEAMVTGGAKTEKVWSQMDELIQSYLADWKEEMAGLVDVEVEETLFNKMLGGTDVNLTQYENAAQAYIDAANQWAEAMAAFETGKLTGGLSEEQIFETELALKKQYKSVMDLYDAYAYWKSAIDDSESAVERHSESIDIYITKMSQLQEEIGTIGNLYDGLLGKQLVVAEKEKMVGDMSHYVDLALQEERYQLEMVNENFDWYTQELGDAISVIRAYEQQQKAATEAQKEFNFALAENQIAMMQLQLIGMMRRRGLTRNEQKMMKALQIERTELRIEEAKKELEAEKNKNDEFVNDTDMAYSQAKQIVESFRRAHNHELWLIRQANKDEVQSLINQINTKEQAYVDLLGTVETTHDDMADAIDIYKTLVASYYGDEIPAEIQKSIDAYEALYQAQLKTINTTKKSSGVSPIFTEKAAPTQPTVAKMQESLRRVIPGAFSFARGSRYVPQDMYARVHAGETIVPPGSNKANDVGGKTDINIMVTGNYLSEEIDEDRLARKIGSATSKKLISGRTGKSITRVR